MTNLEKTFLDSLGGDVRRAWDQGHLVPCDECDDGGIPVMHGNTIRVIPCEKCGGTGYMMEKTDD
jgi:hypothetical protein